MNHENKSGNESDLEVCAELLEATGQYQVLRKLPPIKISKKDATPRERVVAIIDTETTGLDPKQDDVIEFAGITATYTPEGEITGVLSTFSQLQETEMPLNEDVTRLTGITRQMLVGKSIDIRELKKFIETADLIVAHNASFDRPFCEKISDVFIEKPWACSATEIDWNAFGFDGAKLTYLITQAGWFYKAHRALDDCNALMRVLRTPRNKSSDQTPFQDLLRSAREIKTRLTFQASPALRMRLKSKGFRWKPAQPTQRGHWYADLSCQDVESRIDWLTKQTNIDRKLINTKKITAYERYRLE